MHRLRAVIFDAYGTLLDIHAAMARHADRLGPNWRQISADWRAKQTEYSWVRTMVGPAHHRDFWRLTQEALEVVAEVHGITDAALKADILAAYRRLDAYPEVPDMLRTLKDRGLACAILSNGEPEMLHDAVTAAGIAPLLDAVLSVEFGCGCTSPIRGSTGCPPAGSTWRRARWGSCRPIRGMRSAPMSSASGRSGSTATARRTSTACVAACRN